MGRQRTYQPEQILVALERYAIQHGRAPTIEEFRQALGVGSSRTVLRYLQELEDGGFIRRAPGARGIQVLRRPSGGTQTQSVLGRVTAGALDLPEQHYDGWLQLPVEDLKPKSAKFFLLRIHGRSMDQAKVAGERIEDGDLVLVRQQTAAEPGAVVVAHVDGEATVKKLARLPEVVSFAEKDRLSPASPKAVLAAPDYGSC
ncbi:MAG TPA: S24 family peptidase [Thermoanaerobaculia bacterium]